MNLSTMQKKCWENIHNLLLDLGKARFAACNPDIVDSMDNIITFMCDDVKLEFFGTRKSWYASMPFFLRS